MAKRSANRSKIFRLAFAAFFVYVVVSFTIMQVDIAKRKENLALVQAQLDEQEYLNEEIRSMLNSGESAEYIMRIAREKLELVFPDERIYIDQNRKK